ncbi:MAG: 16S rRNA (cytidine(1402)-2'-O)-methyltransferase [Clostridia bacterium]
MKPQLFLVATPIGNMNDITLRALEVLKDVDIIACEDTRHTLGLLNHFEIKKPLISYYKQKEIEGSQQIIDLLRQGKKIALVSDAGMPCISDPGSVLVRELQKEEIEYTIIPGASAVVSAIALSGVMGTFTFLGFMPERNKDYEKFINNYKNLDSNLVIYSAPHDLNKIFDKLFISLGERKIYLIKEITKIYENVIIGQLSDLRIDNPKGEFVIVIEGKTEVIIELDDEQIIAILKDKIEEGNDKKQAVSLVCKEFELNKNRVYKLAIDI